MADAPGFGADGPDAGADGPATGAGGPATGAKGPGFGAVLTRLIERRRLADPDIDVAVVGPDPEPDLLQRLAPVLGLHAADLLAAADMPVPDELLPNDPTAGPYVPGLVGAALAASDEQRALLRQHIAALPQEPRRGRFPEPKPYERYPSGPGGALVRMLHVRNLTWSAAATTLAHLGTAPPLAAATIGTIGRGERPLTAQLLNAFAEVLGIPLDVLSILIDTEPADATPSSHDISELIWDLRRLTADQVKAATRYLRGASEN